jgi:hypothetical protein
MLNKFHKHLVSILHSTYCWKVPPPPPKNELLCEFTVIFLLTAALSLQCDELMDSYATLLFAKITEIKPEAFCKRYGLCRGTALFSGVTSDSTCVFCHHLLDEVMSKLKDPDAEVISFARHLRASLPRVAILCLTSFPLV